MPSFFAAPQKPGKCSSRPSISLLRLFDNLYKPSPPPPASKNLKTGNGIRFSKFGSLFVVQEPVRVQPFAPARRESSDSHTLHSEAGSSRQSLDFSSSSDSEPSTPVLANTTTPLRSALKRSPTKKRAATEHRLSGTRDLRHVSFAIPPHPHPPTDPTSFTLHPLFAYVRPTNHAPISCDILYPPSSHTILDRSTRSPISYETLLEPATQPPLYSQLVLKSELFPWEIVVRPNAAATGTSFPFPSTSPAKRRRHRAPISNIDVLFALHESLSEKVTQKEWVRLGRNSRIQRRLSRAYERRCATLGAGWDEGVRRVDWLDGRTRVVGMEVVNVLLRDRKGSVLNSNAPTAVLIFKTPVDS
ncbi:hypothetical protein R3P38DRAFT_548620 [Favolaschia claudopus]|uniref:DUF6699 domain-containing protein n=1 Tax=Favolaschia claudopus TaxID=2862362 RepID=A0AAW0CFT0_9AGAR